MAAHAPNSIAAVEEMKAQVYESYWYLSDIKSQNNSTHVVETGTPGKFQLKWQARAILRQNKKKFSLSWTLLEARWLGIPEGQIQATVCTSVTIGDKVENLEAQDYSVNIKEQNGKIVHHSTPLLKIYYVDTEPKLILMFKIFVMEPPVSPTVREITQFQKTANEKLRSNFTSLLTDEATADLKILTSDGKEHFAHRNILKARCPVFETMFRSDLSENQTGIVNVDGLSGKTMDIFLHYFYTGELTSSWKDPDTVVEFIYGSGKYQLDNILELMDKMLGSREDKDAPGIDVALLDLARKLGLKNAEKELLANVKTKTAQVGSSEELFALFGYE